MTDSTHSEQSTFREKLLEHLFVGKVLRHLWLQRITSAEFLKPEVDNGGYDLIIALGRTIRHIQLKSSHRAAKAAGQKVNVRLAEKPSGCVVWLFFDQGLDFDHFRWFGGPLPDITGFPVAKHTKGNAQGIKNERRNIRVIPKREFTLVPTLPLLIEKLFGSLDEIRCHAR